MIRENTKQYLRIQIDELKNELADSKEYNARYETNYRKLIEIIFTMAKLLPEEDRDSFKLGIAGGLWEESIKYLKKITKDEKDLLN